MRIFEHLRLFAAPNVGLSTTTSRRVVKPVLLATGVALILLLVLLRAATIYGAATQPTVDTSSRTAVSQPSSNTSRTSQSVAPAIVNAPKTVVSAASTAPTCNPDNGYTGPGDMNLTNAAAGLTTSVAPTHYYQVNGYTADQIRQQIITCAPKLSGDDDFTGYTSYRLNWQYNFVGNSDGTCSLSAAKIGITIGEVLPSWTPSQNATAGLASKWTTFVTNLDTHEQGHVALDKQYAAQLLANLQALPAMSCDTISQAATNTINSGLAALNAANDAYDARTNHGATQGAILP